jgi:cytochrome c oxidase subunit 2
VKKLHKALLGIAAVAAVSVPALAASGPASPTDAWNHLWKEVLIDLFIIGGLFAIATVVMLVKYRAKSPDAVGDGPVFSSGQMWAWILVPAALFMADDFMLSAKGWSLWNIQREVPAGAMEVKVTASQWFFEFQYEGGVTSDELVVPVGKPVVLRMTATDVVHSFGLNEYRLKEDVMPGRVTYMWFLPSKPQVTKVLCVEFCGTGHAEMNAPVRAVPQAEFDAWLAKKKPKTS